MKNKKLIFFGALAIGGLIATAVTTTWGSFKAAEKIREEKPETKKEAVKLVWKYYIPAGVALGTTIIADVCFYRIGVKEFAALTASVSYLTANRTKLEKKLKAVVGEEKFDEIKKDIQKEIIAEQVAKDPGAKRFNNAFETGYGDTLFYDGWGGRFFRSSIEEVLDGIKRFNESYNIQTPENGDKIICCPVSMNDYYSYMHLPVTGLGQNMGFPANEDWIKPGTILIDPDKIYRVTEAELLDAPRNCGEDIYVIEPSVDPMPSWDQLSNIRRKQ